MNGGETPSNRQLASELAELNRKVERHEWRATRDFTRIDVYQANRFADLARIENAEKRITTLENRLAYVGRVAVTGIVLPILVGVIVALILTGILPP